jgi:hypothetical protein
MVRRNYGSQAAAAVISMCCSNAWDQLHVLCWVLCAGCLLLMSASVSMCCCDASHQLHVLWPCTH